MVQGNDPVLTVRQINISRPTGHSLRAHFPEVGSEVDRWNDFVDRYNLAMESWRKHQLSEADRLFPQGAWDQSLTGLMSAIARGEVSAMILEWYVESQRISVSANPHGWWGLGRIPTNEESVTNVLIGLWTMVSALYDAQVAKEWREAQSELAERRTSVLDALEGAAITRDPPGTCDGCPK
jgi:hypothetical protein